MLQQRKAVATKTEITARGRKQPLPEAVLSTDRWSASNPADLPEAEWNRWFNSPEGTAHREACWTILHSRIRYV